MNNTNENIFITKFIDQKCLGYNPRTDKSQWHMVATWTDGRTREITCWLGVREHVSGDVRNWTITS